MGNEPEIQSKSNQELAVNELAFKQRVRRIVWHPLFGIAAGGVIAGYFYLASLTKPGLTYYISSTRTPIVQKENLDNFSVKFQGVQITNDLSTAEIQIWNQGNAPIRRDDILEPVTIKTWDGAPIYQATAKIERLAIGFRWVGALANGKADNIAFDWKILERNDGVKIQIIYGGNVFAPLSVNGTVVGQKQGIFAVNNVNPLNRKYPLIMAACGLLVIFTYFVLQRDFVRDAKFWNDKPLKYVVLSQYIVGVLSVIFGIIFYLMSPPRPPFGF